MKNIVFIIITVIFINIFAGCKKSDLPDTSRDIPPPPSMEVNDPQVLVKDALFYIENNKASIALQALEAALKKGGDKPYVYFLQGRAYLVQKKYKKAMKLFNKAEKNGYSKDEINLYKGKVFAEQKKYKEALKYFKIAEKIIGSDRNRVNNVGVVLFQNLGSLYQKNKKYKLAVKYYSKAVKVDPANFASHFNLGLVYYRINKYNESIHHLKKATEIKPRKLNVYKYLATVYYKIGKKDKSLYTIARGLTISQTYPNLQKAHAELSKMTNPAGDKDALELLIYTKIGLNFLTPAKRFINIGMKKYPADPIFWVFLGKLHLKNNETKKAIKIADKAIKKFGADFDLLSLKGDCYIKSNKEKLAIKNYELALKYNPENFPYRNQLATIYRKNKKRNLEFLHQGIYFVVRGQIEQGKYALTQLPEDFKRKSEVNCWLGRIYMEQGIYKTSLEYIKKSIKENPSYFLPYTFGCFVYFKLGKKAQGLNLLRTFMAKYPNGIGIKEVKKLYKSFSRF